MSDVKKRENKLVKNAVSNWVPLMTNLILGFVITPLMIRHLGKDKYGVWALIGSFIGYYGLLRFGISSGVMRYVPYYNGRQQKREANEIISTSLAVFLVVGAMIFTISYAGAEKIAAFYGGGDDFIRLVKIMGLAAAFECPMRIYDAVLRSHEKWIQANIVTVFTTVFRSGGLVLCIALGLGLASMGAVVLSVTLMELFMAVVFVKRYCPDVEFGLGLIKPTHFRNLTAFGFFTTTITLVTTLRLQGHKLIIGKVISLEAVAIYAVAVMLIKNLKAVVVAPNRVFWPRLSFLHGENDHQRVLDLFNRGTRVNAVFSSMLSMIVIVSGIPFIKLWVGSGFETVYTALIILGLAALVENSFMISGSLLAVTGHQPAHAAISVVEGILGIVLYIFLGIKFGLTGIAVGTLISIGLIRGLVCPYYICRIYNIRLWEVFKSAVIKPWILMFAMIAGAYYLKISDQMDNWFKLVTLSMLLGGAYMGFSFYLILTRQTRKEMTEKIRAIFNDIFRKKENSDGEHDKTDVKKNDKPNGEILRERSIVKE